MGNYWHCLPQYEHARKAMWDAINPNTGRKRIDEAFPQELRSGTDESRMKISFKVGSIWQLVGSDNVDSLVGAPPVGIVYSEWALSDPRSHGLLRPILAENNGWALFIYTARGYNHGFKTYGAAMKDPRSFGQLLTVDDTDIFSADTLEYERQQYIEEFGEEAGDALFRQEFYCDFSAANLGAILGRGLETAQREGRIDLTAAEYDPSGPGLIVSADIGYRDAAAFWAWQPHVDGVALTNYDEDTGLDADDWIVRLQENFPPIDTLWLPHDAKAKTFRSKRSVVEVFLAAKPAVARVIDVTPDARIKDRINAARRVLKVSRFAPGTAKGVNALRSWSFKYDEKTHTLSSEPEHNWACTVAGTHIAGAGMVEHVRVGDSVITPLGARKITATFKYDNAPLLTLVLADGRRVQCSPSHCWFTARGLVAADALCYDDRLFTGREWIWRAISWISKAAGTIFAQAAISSLYLRENSAVPGFGINRFIKRAGSTIALQFQRAAKYITATVTSRITGWRILNCSPAVSTNVCTVLKTGAHPLLGTVPSKDEPIMCALANWDGSGISTGRSALQFQRSYQHEKPPARGTGVLKGLHGIVSMASESGQPEPVSTRLVRSALKLLLRFGPGLNIAGQLVRLEPSGSGTVYGLEVEHEHCYIANGILSANSHGGDSYSYGAQVVPVRVTRKHTQVMEALQEQALARIKLDDFEFRKPNRMRL